MVKVKYVMEEVKDKPEDFSYPFLGRSRVGSIVFYTAHGKGVCLQPASKACCSKTGEYSVGWNMKGVIKLADNEYVTIRNEENVDAS